jgi:hypothetical protein
VNKLLKECFPDLANELRELLVNEADLAAGVDELRLIDKCRCGDDFCASFYTSPPPDGAWGEGHENIVLEPKEGMIVLDVVDRDIVMVEVLNRNDVKEAIDRLVA